MICEKLQLKPGDARTGYWLRLGQTGTLHGINYDVAWWACHFCRTKKMAQDAVKAGCHFAARLS